VRGADRSPATTRAGDLHDNSVIELLLPPGPLRATPVACARHRRHWFS